MEAQNMKAASVWRTPAVRVLTILTLLFGLVAILQHWAWAPFPAVANGFILGATFGFAVVLLIAIFVVRRSAENV
jgi:uncharacterized membrane protein